MKHMVLILLLIVVFVLTNPAMSDFSTSSSRAVPINSTTGIAPAFAEMKEGEVLSELRVMTYNIHHGRGMDGIFDMERIAQVIRDARADIVGLNEVDVRMARSGMMDESKYLGARLEMNSAFIPSLRFPIGQYGNALLSKLPILDARRVELPKFAGREQRTLGMFTVRLQEQIVHVFVTHLGLNPVERQIQLDFLAEKIKSVHGPKLVLGDFNATDTSMQMIQFMESTGLTVHSYKPTFPANLPQLKIDYVLTSEEWEEVEEVEPILTIASDHLPLVGKLRLKANL